MADRPYDVDDVVILIRDGGRYYDQERLSLKEIGGLLPDIGDTWTVHPQFGGLAAYRVVERYLSNVIVDADDRDHQWYWFLVVEQFESDELFDFDNAVREIFGAKVSVEELANLEALEELDRDNRDPAYWTTARKKLLRKERETRLATVKTEEPTKKI